MKLTNWGKFFAVMGIFFLFYTYGILESTLGMTSFLSFIPLIPMSEDMKYIMLMLNFFAMFGCLFMVMNGILPSEDTVKNWRKAKINLYSEKLHIDITSPDALDMLEEIKRGIITLKNELKTEITVLREQPQNTKRISKEIENRYKILSVNEYLKDVQEGIDLLTDLKKSQYLKQGA